MQLLRGLAVILFLLVPLSALSDSSPSPECLAGKQAVDLSHLFPNEQNKQQFGTCYLNAANTLVCGMNVKLNQVQPIWTSDSIAMAKILLHDLNPKNLSKETLRRFTQATRGEETVIDGGTIEHALNVLLSDPAYDTVKRSEIVDELSVRFIPELTESMNKLMREYPKRVANAEEGKKYTSVKASPFNSMAIETMLKILDFEKAVRQLSPQVEINLKGSKVKVENFPLEKTIQYLNDVGGIVGDATRLDQLSKESRDSLDAQKKKCAETAIPIKSAILQRVCAEAPVALGMALNFLEIQDGSRSYLLLNEQWDEKTRKQGGGLVRYPLAGHAWVVDGYDPKKGFRVINNTFGPQGKGPNHLYVPETELCRVMELTSIEEAPQNKMPPIALPADHAVNCP